MHYGYYYGCLFLYWWLWVLVNLLKMVKVMEIIQIKVNGYKVDIIVNKLTKDELIWSVFDVDTDHNDFFDELLHENYQDEIETKVLAALNKIKADKTTDDRLSNLSIDELTECKQGLGIL